MPKDRLKFIRWFSENLLFNQDFDKSIELYGRVYNVNGFELIWLVALSGYKNLLNISSDKDFVEYWWNWILHKRFPCLHKIKEILESNKKENNLRSSAEYRNWRNMILIRDGWKCVECMSNEQLEVDHIKPFYFFPDLRLDLENGRTLCHSCHEKTDTYMSKLFSEWLPKNRHLLPIKC